MTSAYPFDSAVANYIAGLDDIRRKVLCETALNPQASDDWHWFEEIIEHFQLRDKKSPVRRDINERVEPDPNGINSLLWFGVGNDEPIFEAMTILDAARKALLVTRS